ncbi:hypothetical protein FV233_22580 [Methylobacterium sp. WL7]|nr:hypothetical protein FV233_22580 [Methylobacterium sp. WL7]
MDFQETITATLTQRYHTLSLRIARPWKDPKSGVYHLRQRTPLDLVARLKGQIVSLPIGAVWASVRIGPIVQASLRTKEPREARVRHSLADGALKRIWQGERSDKHPHSHDQGTTDSPRGDRGLTNASAGVSVKPQPVPFPTKRDGPSLSVGELFERWATDRADKRAPNTIKRYRGSIRSFEAFAAGRDVRTLTGNDVFAWAVHRRDRESISPRAINKNDLVAVSSVFRWGTGRASGQILLSNPATGISLDEPRGCYELNG